MKYDDIIHLPHPVSSRHPQMPLSDRAAQFSPFAALTGHDAAIRETARLTEEKAELDEDGKELLNEKLQMINEALPEVEVTYFQPDARKNGGTYRKFRGRVKKIDEYNRMIFFADQTAVPIDDLYSIEIIRC